MQEIQGPLDDSLFIAEDILIIVDKNLVVRTPVLFEVPQVLTQAFPIEFDNEILLRNEVGKLNGAISNNLAYQIDILNLFEHGTPGYILEMMGVKW